MHRIFFFNDTATTEIYTGGVFQLRRRGCAEILTETPNTGPGDAILFRIDDQFEHRITDVEGTVAKTAFAGWFVSEPDFVELLMRHATAATE